jgi:mono/diheme cytochrome c family protein
MGKVLVGLLLGLLIFPAIVVAYVMLGFAPAAATAPPMPFEKFLAGTALEKRISLEAPQRDLSTFTDKDLVAGADVYRKNCAMCHGLPPQPPPPFANAMFPKAPQLLRIEGMVTDDPVGVTYWKVDNGIRLSAMPSFKGILTDEQKWDVSALLAHADDLPAPVKTALQPLPDAIAPALPPPLPESK